MGQKIAEYFGDQETRAEHDPVLEKQVREAMKNHRLAMMTVRNQGYNIDESVLEVETLTGNRVAQILGGKITVDPVVFKSYKDLLEAYLHEAIHDEGIYNEGLVQLVMQKLGIEDINEIAAQDYKEEQEATAKVIDVVGLDIAVHLYKKGNFTELKRRFVQLYMRYQEKTKEEADQTFFKAFTELTIKKAP
ncbi:MAG: hypothetical protein ABH856_03045 [Patescibacteria group bacterium]|nr:hypothetical protein [Patescibacteria group bacterium]